MRREGNLNRYFPCGSFKVWAFQAIGTGSSVVYASIQRALVGAADHPGLRNVAIVSFSL